MTGQLLNSWEAARLAGIGPAELMWQWHWEHRIAPVSTDASRPRPRHWWHPADAEHLREKLAERGAEGGERDSDIASPVDELSDFRRRFAALARAARIPKTVGD